MLENKIILITGASSGIGEACVRRFSARGANVIMVARRIDRLQTLAEELETKALAIRLDVRDAEAVAAAINDLPEEWKAVDVLVNNAGLGRGLDKFHESSREGWDEMIDTNVKGLLYVSRALVPDMVKRQRGHIINIGSIAGHEVYPGGSVYCATKHAVDAITKGMRLDLVDTPIRVSTVDPGLVRTEFSEVRFYGDVQRAKTVYEGYQPLTPDDIAEAVVWIAERPPHVQIAQMIVFPTAQASSMVVHKKK